MALVKRACAKEPETVPPEPSAGTTVDAPTDNARASVVHLDMDAGRLFVDGRLRRDFAGSPRQLEIVATLAAEGGSMEIRRLVRRSRKPLHPREARRLLRKLEQDGITTEVEPDTWTLAFGSSAHVQPEAPVIGAALERLRVRMGADGRLGLAADELAAAVFEAEQALRRGNIVGAERLLNRWTSYDLPLMRAIDRVRSGKRRAELAVMARSDRAKVEMTRGKLAQARSDIRIAEAYADRTAGLDEHLVSLACTSAALWRMEAALHPATAAEALAESRSAFRLARARALRAKLPTGIQNNLLSWTHSEASTPLAIELGMTESATAALHKAQSIVATAMGFAEGSSDQEASYTNCLFMQLRLALLEPERPDVVQTRDELLKRAPAWGTSDGWLPRYLADFEWATGGRSESLRALLCEAWVKNDGNDFQRMLVLARYCYWQLDPIDADAGVAQRARDSCLRREMTRFLDRWHVNLHGIPPSRCSTCHDARNVLTRIACTLRLGPESGVGPLSLGLWR